MIGEVIDDKYKITRLIGEGGMGVVYEGENLRISRRVAIKVLHAAMALNQQTVERFQREARAAGKIGNDHILEVLDLGRLPNGDHYMVLEFLDGEPLSERIQRKGKMSAAEVAPILRQVLAGLAAAHGAGIIHRDLKPENIFILKEKAGHKDFVKIIDFGISKFSVLTDEETRHRMTQTGTIMGTPYYMSPEQARGTLDADARSDLYSAGVIAYEALSGQVPFDGKTINELMFNIALSDPKPLAELVPELDVGFQALIAKAMARDLKHRYQTADEFLGALSEWQGSRTGITVAQNARGYTGSMPQVIERSAHSLPDADASPPAAEEKVTPSPWSTSQADDVTLPKQSSSLVLAAILGGVVVLAGGGFAAYRMLADNPLPPKASAEPPSAIAPPAPVTAEEPAPSPAEPVSEPTSQPAVSIAPTVASAEREPPPEVKPAPAVARPTAAQRPAKAKPASKAAPAAQKPAPAAQEPKPEPAAPQKKKPGIMQFGY